MGTKAESNNKQDTPLSRNDIIRQVWERDVVLALDKAKELRINNDNADIRKERIIVKHNDADKTVTLTRSNSDVCGEGRGTSRYIMPSFANEVECIVRQALEKHSMANICLTGSAGTGKTEFVYEIAKEFGLKVYHVNGSEGLTNADFYGGMAVAVDESTRQNYTYFEKGPLYRAFIEGTQVDENGNQVLDANGEPIVTGKPSIFFLDEFAAMLPEVFLGVFNRAMEIPRTSGKSRSIEIPMDNGRIVKSHPGMVMFLAGNTVGTGNSGRYQMGFTAQSNKMDESTRNRITAFYRFGYNREAERQIATSLLNDDKIVDMIMQFRDNVRTMYKNEKVETLFTTRSVVVVCDMIRVLRGNNIDGYIGKALKRVIYNGLPETDKDAFAETAKLILGINYEYEDSQDKSYDYI